jgi:oligopeptide/dipeptide ABC transporter ATP-binding protein
LFGKPLAATVSARSPALRRQMQMVFQDPQASINPAMRVAKIVAEPLAVHEPNLSAAERSKKVAAMLEHVGLAKSLSQRFPHQLSGGQAQRVAIARALIAAPRILVCDEAVSALDATVRAEVLELLRREQAQSGLSIILITHDLGVVRSLAHRVLVMYLGRVCETSATEDLFRTPRHPYSKALIESIPTANAAAPEKQETIRGEPGSVLHPPQGCVFHPRCLYAEDRCRSDTPTLTASANGEVACLRAAQLELGPADLPMGK